LSACFSLELINTQKTCFSQIDASEGKKHIMLIPACKMEMNHRGFLCFLTGNIMSHSSRLYGVGVQIVFPFAAHIFHFAVNIAGIRRFAG